MSDKSIV